MIGILILTLIAFIISFIIIVIDDKTNESNLKTDIEKSLPGYNCGGCGFGSCKGMVEKILEDPNNYTKCRVLKDKTELLKVFKKYNIKVKDGE